MQCLIQLIWLSFWKILKRLSSESSGGRLLTAGCGWMHFQFCMAWLASIRLCMHGCVWWSSKDYSSHLWGNTNPLRGQECTFDEGLGYSGVCWVLRPNSSEAPPRSLVSVSEPLAPGHQLVIGEGIMVSTYLPCKEFIAHFLGLELLSRRIKSLNLTLDEWYLMGQQVVDPSWQLPPELSGFVVPAHQHVRPVMPELVTLWGLRDVHFSLSLELQRSRRWWRGHHLTYYLCSWLSGICDSAGTPPSRVQLPHLAELHEDPVTANCGDNFCHSCVNISWKEICYIFPCPVCHFSVQTKTSGANPSSGIWFKSLRYFPE